MATTKPSISLSAVSLEVGRPQFGKPDLTELRILIRTFPKDAGERGCFRYLLERMQATPDRHRGTKAELEKRSRRRFHVTAGTFDYCWREAIKATGALGIAPGAAHAKDFRG